MVEIPTWILLVLGAGAIQIAVVLFSVIDLAARPLDRWIWRSLTQTRFPDSRTMEK
jgi:hypothetical protein